MPKVKILVTIPQEPNFDPWALKYCVLALNSHLKSIEFWFADSAKFIFDAGTVSFDAAATAYNAQKEVFFTQNGDPPDYTVAIISAGFDNNYFGYAKEKLAIMTTDVWERHFSPPSVFEYIVHSIAAAIIFMDSQLELDSHEWVKGCIMDFNRFKTNNRASILCGYISERVSERILAIRGQDFLADIKFILSRSWLGSLEERGSVAWNLKHTYKLDMFRDSGFTKRWHERVLEHFYELPQKTLLAIITAIAGGIVGYYLKR